MRKNIEALAQDYDWYKVRKPEYDQGDKLPFRISPTPLELSPEQSAEITQLGQEVTQFMQAADELYHHDDTVRNLLNTGKPEVFLVDRPSQYPFVRPDLIITAAGFSICEIETSPFGLGLADLLNKSYQQAGFDTLVDAGALTEHIRTISPDGGYFLYSPKTSSYAGQISYLTDQAFSDGMRHWQTAKTGAYEHAQQAGHPESMIESGFVPKWTENVYRGFYLSEYLNNPDVRAIIDRFAADPQRCILPSLTPHLEEKALLALLWDSRFEEFFKKQLGEATFRHLRKVVPETWIVGQEKYFAPGLPNNFSTTADLATLSRSKRTFVLKPSGFHGQSSWAEGVELLHEKSGDKAGELIHQAEQDHTALHIVQSFHKAMDLPMSYEAGEEIVPMLARVRVTPYFAMMGGQEGQLITIKATAREKTDFIHGATDSINTAVSAKGA